MRAKDPSTETTPTEAAAERDLLDGLELPVAHADLRLASGRRYAIDAGADADRLVVRGRGGDVVLRIEITEAGPVLSMTGAVLELRAARQLVLEAERVALRARGALAIEAGGALTETVGGDRHVCIGGVDRLEAAALERQADAGGVSFRARDAIALDGERVALNGDPRPAPFGWSRAGNEEQEEQP